MKFFIAPSCLYRVERQTAGLLRELDRSGCPGRRSSAFSQAQWRRRGPSLPQAGRTKWRDLLQSRSKVSTDLHARVGKGRALLGGRQWLHRGPPFPELVVPSGETICKVG